MLKSVGAQVHHIELPPLPPVSVLLWIVCNSRSSSGALWTVVWFGNDDTRRCLHTFSTEDFFPQKTLLTYCYLNLTSWGPWVQRADGIVVHFTTQQALK